MGCIWLFFHDWSKWTDIESGLIAETSKILDLNSKDRIVGRYLIQERKCEACGKKERNSIRTFSVAGRDGL